MAEALTSIPLSQLVASSANVRKTGADDGLEELVASIATNGLLQNLTVRPIPKGNGKPSGKYEVVAGGRRLAALNRLAEEKRLAKNYAVPCLLLDGDAVSASLAENVVRAPLHPADQYEAFARLNAEGLSAEDIAARFGIEPGVVTRRLKLAAVSPRLIEAYRAGDATLEQLMAFTISDDHALQEQVWAGLPSHGRDPHSLRRALTRTLVRGNERMARFVGVKAYEAAGGTVVRDLFDDADEGYFTDAPLLGRLAKEQLEAAAEEAKAEGWAWVEAMPELDYGRLSRFRRVYPTPVPLTAEEEAKLDELAAKHDALIEELDDDASSEATAEIDRLSKEIDALSERTEVWSDDDRARSGVILSISPLGTLTVERGLVIPEEGSQADGQDAEESAPPAKPRVSRDPLAYPDALIEDLTAHKTAALRAVLAGKPDVVLSLLVHAVVIEAFFDGRGETCLGLRWTSLDLRPAAEGIAGSQAVQAMAKRHEAWLARLPEERELWPWCARQDLDTKLELLAYGIALTVSVVRKRYDRPTPEWEALADEVARASGLDMADWWEPTAERFLGHLSKAQVAAAVAEAVSQEAAQEILPLKKDAMVARALELLSGRRWLPAILRTAAVPAEGASPRTDV